MSGRFPDERPVVNGVTAQPGGHTAHTPDHTLSCALCHSPLQDGRVLPNCLHSCCRSCLERQISGGSTMLASCPAANCGKPVNSNIEDLSSNPYSNIILDIQDNSDTLSDFEKLSVASGSTGSRYGPVAAPLGIRHSPPGLHQQRPFEADWRPSAASVQDAWSKNPLNFNPLGDIMSVRPKVMSDGWSAAPGVNTVKPRSSPAAGPMCNCGDGHLVTSRCRDCNDDLCDSCVVAHQRVKLTRDHAIVRYPDNNQTRDVFGHVAPVGSSAPAPNDVLRVFNETVEKAKQENQENISKAQNGYIECEKGLERISKRSTQIAMNVNQVSDQIKDVTQHIVYAVKEREQFLLNKLDKIRTVKMTSLENQEQEIRQCMMLLDKVVGALEKSNRSAREMDIIDMNKKAAEIISNVRDKCGPLEPYEDATVVFHPPAAELVQKVASEGNLMTTGYAPHACAEGDGLHKGVMGREAKFLVFIKDHVGDLCPQADGLKVQIAPPDSRPVFMETVPDPMQPGRVLVRWRPHVEGEYKVSIRLHNRHIQDSPFSCLIKSGRDYNNVGVPVLEFSKEGSGDGDLCRPWGICCTPGGLLVVADRSNNRICLFRRDGSFHSKFGVEGTRPGQFNRPAGVCLDSNNRLIVTDKDNHRMQIFTLEGEFLLKFGEKGSNAGQFMYPWDVACNSKNQILVSDTRNHRLQLFSPNGEYLTKYGFDGQMWKHFDSPRGVCFTQDDQAIVTDFNNHRLLVIKSNFCSAQFLGCEGTKDGEFTRPNGVTVDDEGNIIVADSRNHRIQVFSSSGVFLKKFGTNGPGSGELDRPCGICMTNDGLIAVVDFGNTRVSLF